MKSHKFISTGLGIGYIGKGAGTFAAIATCLCWYLFQTGYPYPGRGALIFTVLVTAIGVRSSGIVEKIWGKDHQRVVIDEVAGMCVSLLFVPIQWKYMLAALILFRFFDILKPLFIRRMEKLKGGWGVMADDILAGVYANFILQLVIHFGIFT